MHINHARRRAGHASGLAICFLTLALVPLLPMSAEAQDGMETRFGILSVDADNETDRTLTLRLDGRWVLDYEGESLEVSTVIKNKDRDYAVVAKNSGAEACPVQLVIVELYMNSHFRLSPEFDTCTTKFEVKLTDHGALILEAPLYIPHPETFTERQLRDAARSVQVYTWSGGKLTKKVKGPFRP